MWFGKEKDSFDQTGSGSEGRDILSVVRDFGHERFEREGRSNQAAM